MHHIERGSLYWTLKFVFPNTGPEAFAPMTLSLGANPETGLLHTTTFVIKVMHSNCTENR